MAGNRSRKPGQGDTWGFDSSTLRWKVARAVRGRVANPRPGSRLRRFDSYTFRRRGARCPTGEPGGEGTGRLP